MSKQEIDLTSVEKAKQDIVELVRRKIVDEGNVNLFIETVMKDEKTGDHVKQAVIHMAIQEHIDYCFKHNKLCGILAPWGHGKTSQIIGRVLHMIGSNPNIRTKILCNNDITAKARLRVIGQYIEKDKDFREIFPKCIPADKDKWNSHELLVHRTTISKDPTVQSYGILSSGIGGRTDLLIVDDVVDMRNAILQPALKKQITETFQNTWLSRSDGIDFKVLYIATVWTDDDLSAMLLKNSAFSFLKMGINDDFSAIQCKYTNRNFH